MSNQKVSVRHGVSAQVVRTPALAPKCRDAISRVVEIAHAKFHAAFTAIADEARDQDLPSSTLIIPMLEDTVGVLPGQYVAELHFVVHRMPDDKAVDENLPLPWQQPVPERGE